MYLSKQMRTFYIQHRTEAIQAVLLQPHQNVMNISVGLKLTADTLSKMILSRSFRFQQNRPKRCLHYRIMTT